MRTTRQKHKARAKTEEARSARRKARKVAQACPGSEGGHPHGHVCYRRKGVVTCHYCDQPVAP